MFSLFILLRVYGSVNFYRCFQSRITGMSLVDGLLFSDSKKLPVSAEIYNQLQLEYWWLFVLALYIIFSILASTKNVDDWV
jgi:hypothetical protein